MTLHFPASAVPPLANSDVHVWQASLQQPEAVLEALRPLLSADETQRAARFHFVADQRRYLVGRGLLRLLLGHYLAAEPATLAFAYNAYGKPYIAATTDTPSVQFNLSHSGDIVFYAVARHYHLGVDVERIRPEMDWAALAQHVFSPVEQRTLATLLPAEQVPAFFRGWTRKEAFIKARGMGLSLPLDQFDVTLAPDKPAQLLATRDDPHDAARWTLRDMPCPTGYAAALAVAGHDWRCLCLTIKELGNFTTISTLAL